MQYNVEPKIITKVKMFEHRHNDALEEAINNFIKDKSVVDIKYTSTVDDYNKALVIYREYEEDK